MKPMLAATVDVKAGLNKLPFPLYASPKLDGVRCLIINGVPYARSLKVIRSKAVTKYLGRSELNHMDGELISGSPTDADVYNTTIRCTQKIEGHDDFKFHVFDMFEEVWRPYEERYKRLEKRMLSINNPHVVLHQHKLIKNVCELEEYEAKMLDVGYEGLILRRTDGAYKFGRSTLNEGHLIKLKRFEDSEAVILDFEEEMHNGNEATTNELGRTKRSSAKAGLIGKGVLGNFVVKDIHTGVEFRVGSGMTHDLKQQVWQNKRKWKGKIIKYKHFPIGVVDKPRHPVYIGLRSPDDM